MWSLGLNSSESPKAITWGAGRTITHYCAEAAGILDTLEWLHNATGNYRDLSFFFLLWLCWCLWDCIHMHVHVCHRVNKSSRLCVHVDVFVHALVTPEIGDDSIKHLLSRCYRRSKNSATFLNESLSSHLQCSSEFNLMNAPLKKKFNSLQFRSQQSMFMQWLSSF